VNPKAWVFALAAVGTFLSDDLPIALAVLVLTTILMVVVAGSSWLWAAGGSALGRVVDDQRTMRVISIVLAVLLLVSVALIWI
jgi:threonine/homoserine/homoserine lactone efflux protein